MGKAGYSNAEIMQALPGVLNSAAAEGTSLADTVPVVTNVLRGMGLAASQTTHVADVLTLASARTNSSITSLGESMALLAPTAHQLKIPLEDTVAIVASLQNVGLDASTAATAAATMFSKLAKPKDDIAAKMRSMGVAFKDAKGDMLPPVEVFANLSKAASKAGGTLDQVGFFTDLVGLRGQRRP